MKKIYDAWNKGGAKNLQVIVISGDKEAEGFKESIDGMPWVALPLKSEASSKLQALVPCKGYPTPGIIDGKTGAVIVADVFEKLYKD